MNGYTRIQSALDGQFTDAVPIMLHNFMMAAHEAGYSMEEFRNDPHIIAESFTTSVEKYDYDGILIDIDTATLAGAVGVPIDFPVHEPARPKSSCLDSLEHIENLEQVNLTDYKYVNIWLEAVQNLKDHFKNEKFIRGNCDQAPFSLASMMRMPENWMIDLIENEEKAFLLLDYCTDVSLQFISLMAEAGADMVSNGDSPAGPEMISPEMYAHFALPYESKLVEKAHELGLPYALHII
jgi:uroporphyrinogen decarboxylase